LRKVGLGNFYQKKRFIIETGRSQVHVQKGHQEFLYIDSFVISWPLFFYSIEFFGYEETRKYRRGP